MQKVLLAWNERVIFSPQAFLAATVCALALGASPLHGQDDSGAPPPDTSAAPAPDNGMSPAPDNGASPPDASENAPDDSAASFQTFYDALGSQGTWIQSSDYGYVWQPQVTDPDWAPYTAGHWVYTEDGWTWVSDESWGWATYHYGRWVNLDGTGWVWVPGYTWAPAWVSWRYGDGYCGWAPLPPDSFVGVDYFGDGFAIGIGFHIGGDCDGFYGIGAGCYNFVPVNCLGYRNYRGYYRNRNDNFALINRTTNVTSINVTREGATGGAAGGAGRFQRVTTGGPSLAAVNAASQTPVQRVNLVRANQPGGGGTLTRDTLAIYAPHVNTRETAQPSRVAGSIGQARINRGTDITRPLAVNSRLVPSIATEAQVQQARLAQDHAPVSAKVVTESTPVRPVLRTPLTSLKPMAITATPSARVFNPASNTIFPTERAPSSSPVVTPSTRVYPQTGEDRTPSRVYSPAAAYPPAAATYAPRSGATETEENTPARVYNPGGVGGTASHEYVRPTTQVPVVPAAAAPRSSDGGSARSSGGGGASRSESNGGSGATHASGVSGTPQQSH